LSLLIARIEQFGCQAALEPRTNRSSHLSVCDILVCLKRLPRVTLIYFNALGPGASECGVSFWCRPCLRSQPPVKYRQAQVEVTQTDRSAVLPDKVLSRLDIVVAAVRYKFDLPRAAETERIIRTMDRYVLAHPTGRLDRGARCLRARYGPASRHCA
jgi:hypothetical protein